MRYKALDGEFKVNEHPFWKAVEDGEWELAVIEKLIRTVRPTDVIFDVGAWIGPYTLLLSKLARSVVAFEPCPSSRQILEENLRLNGITNVTVEPLALSDVEGVETIYYYNPTHLDDILAASMLNMVDRGDKGVGLSLPVTTIDAYCERHGIKPNGIKIDVEGYESKVLRGCHQDCWVLVETHGAFAESLNIKGTFIDGNWNHGHLFAERINA